MNAALETVVNCLKEKGWNFDVDEAQGRTEDAIRHLGRAVAILAKLPGHSGLDPRPGYARVLRKVGRTAEAEEVERQIRPRSPRRRSWVGSWVRGR